MRNRIYRDIKELWNVSLTRDDLSHSQITENFGYLDFGAREIFDLGQQV